MEDQTMKTRKFFRQFAALFIYFLLGTMFSCTTTQKEGKTVQDAYDLRMNGQESPGPVNYQKKKWEIVEKEFAVNPEDPDLLVSKLEWCISEPELTKSNEIIIGELVKKIEASDEVLGVYARSRVTEEEVSFDRWLELLQAV
jgi:hypothetical protein